MLMDQSRIAGKHPLHHVLSVLWEFQPSHLISGMAQPGAGSSEGTEGITRVWAKALRNNRGAPQTKTVSRVLIGRLVRVNGRDTGTNSVKKSVTWSSKTLILMFFLVQVALSGSCQFVSFKEYEKDTI